MCAHDCQSLTVALYPSVSDASLHGLTGDNTQQLQQIISEKIHQIESVRSSGSSTLPLESNISQTSHLQCAEAPSRPICRSFTHTARTRPESYKKEEIRRSKSAAQVNVMKIKGYINMEKMKRLDTPDRQKIEHFIKDLGKIRSDDQEDSSDDEGTACNFFFWGKLG